MIAYHDDALTHSTFTTRKRLFKASADDEAGQRVALAARSEDGEFAGEHPRLLAVPEIKVSV
jgi:hypothetical protein